MKANLEVGYLKEKAELVNEILAECEDHIRMIDRQCEGKKIIVTDDNGKVHIGTFNYLSWRMDRNKISVRISLVPNDVKGPKIKDFLVIDGFALHLDII